MQQPESQQTSQQAAPDVLDPEGNDAQIHPLIFNQLLTKRVLYNVL